jgi:hypothetical protein
LRSPTDEDEQDTVWFGSQLWFGEELEPLQPKDEKKRERTYKEIRVVLAPLAYLQILLVGSLTGDLNTLISLAFHCQFQLARILIAIL